MPRLIETARVRARTVHVHRPTLDDVFLHYTGRQIRDEHAERALPPAGPCARLTPMAAPLASAAS